MKIVKVKLTAAKSALLDFLDLTVFPSDEVYPKAGATWWIVYDGKTPVGFAGIKRWGNSMAFLCRVGVLKEYRGKGIHRRLLRVRESWAREAGIKSMITYVAPYNVKSANNLIRSGFILYRPIDNWGIENALYFWKDL